MRRPPRRRRRRAARRRWRARASWAGRDEVGVAVELTVVVAPRGRAVGRGLRGTARAALEDAGLVAGQALVHRVRDEDLARGVVLDLEDVEVRADAREVPVGVVVGGALAEVLEEADDLRRVRAAELQD